MRTRNGISCLRGHAALHSPRCCPILMGIGEGSYRGNETKLNTKLPSPVSHTVSSTLLPCAFPSAGAAEVVGEATLA